MITKNVDVKINEEGTRPIAKLVQIASQYQSKVCIKQENKTVNAKSIMGMMTLGLVYGQTIDIEVDGEDESDAMQGIETFLNGD
ncbi:HPr family phosphocarrier protein [Eubacterium xylanophilum]|uniref:HPr family phosphocarrier protein n=1 Tax=Eubacterium xylanophilum TaxID=39497 RepID=UPI00047DBF0F|nr:HPr family phosphocarrier protein [Eubacterium xylanophilum]MCR5797115.1 HPr family phosphocarrier protein [Eubacterium sp.]